MPPQYVKAYVKRNKNDAADAEAICEAVKRPSMRFVPVKTAEQQAALLTAPRAGAAGSPAHHAGQCAARAFGRVRPDRGARSAQGGGADRDRQGRATTSACPSMARQVLRMMAEQIERLETRIAASRRRSWPGTRATRSAERLATIPGIGPIIATRHRGDGRGSRACSAVAGSLPPGWASCRGRTPPAAKHGSAGSANAATAISGVCWSTAHTRCCCDPRRARLDPWLIALRAPEASPGRRRGLGEQDGTHRLGDHEQTGYLPMRGSGGMTCRACGGAGSLRGQ